MLKRRDTKMSSRGKENVNTDPTDLKRDERPKELVTQILGERYMDVERMQEFLRSQFGDDWKMQVCRGYTAFFLLTERLTIFQVKLGRFTIATPRALTEVNYLPPYLDTTLTVSVLGRNRATLNMSK
jgi:hypothetical protein